MMFATLIPSLVKRAQMSASGPRLDSIYRRSFKNVTIIDRFKLPDPEIFDYQSPLGSVPQYRFNDIKDYAKHTPILKANQKSQTLKKIFRR